MKKPSRLASLVGLWLAASVAGLGQKPPVLPRETLAAQNFGADAPWFLNNIPFLEIDDPEIQQIYYYRWKLFRSHVREIGAQGATVTEFLDDVPWARHPYTDLNDSTPFHLLEGRWLRDAGIVNSLIDHEYSGGGNDRHFSEWIASAAEATTRVTGDLRPALRHLDAMRYVYNQWDDHFDRARGLYWIEPLLDATEYTISSIDASGAGFTDQPSKQQSQNGFNLGFAYRPSINSYQYANAMAIASLASFAGDGEVAADYLGRARKIQASVLDRLWNPALLHFTDRYQRSTKTVVAGEFIRGRELVGYTPWMFELVPPSDATEYGVAWKHALSAEELGGPRGLRTVEPTYPKYMVQYRYDMPTGLRECQWNGPSWPFQTSEALTAMANLLDDYPAAGVTRADYLRLLRQYTAQHVISPGHPDLQEDYDPDKGGPIVGLPRSHHYAHSTYVDLVIGGLVGVRPRLDDVLEIDPLVPAAGEGSDKPIRYFALEGLRYHQRDVAVVWDSDGKRYGIGAGLSVFVNGTRASGPGPLAPVKVKLPLSLKNGYPEPRMPFDLAVNVGVPEGPVGSASSSATKDGIAQAIDGRTWFFPEIANGWSPAAGETTSWYAVDFKSVRTVDSIELDFFDGDLYRAPQTYTLQYRVAEDPNADPWKDIPGQTRTPAAPLAGGENRITFPPIRANAVRLTMVNPTAPATVRLIELKAFGLE